MCAKLRDYLQRNVSNPLDMKRFLFFSSIILYLYGLRKPNDIDIIGYELPLAKGKTHNLFETFGSTGKNILNIGGGSGREALVMAKNNLNVSIVDVSVEILKLAKKKLIKSNCYKNVNLI